MMMMMMMRLLLAFIVSCFTLVTATLATIRLQPYGDDGLGSALLATTCTLPCFMDIRPGVTTRDEALAILRTHPWVATVDNLLGERGLTWTWSGEQPTFLRGGHTENSLLIGDSVVRRIDLVTGANLATFLLVFGAPDDRASTTWSVGDLRTNTYSDFLVQTFTYDAYQMEVSALGQCPLSASGQWALDGRISLYEQPDRLDFSPTFLDRTPLVLYALGGGCR